MMEITFSLQLSYAPEARGEIRGWYLPCAELQTWLAACARESTNATKYYLAPRSNADRTADGLIALRGQSQRNKRQSHEESLECPAGAIPLICLHQSQGDMELWLPWFSELIPDVPLAELLSGRKWDDAQRLVWLPHAATGQERLIRLDADDEVDMSVLLKPVPQSPVTIGTSWQRPPIAARLPDRVMGLQISRDLLGANPFSDEQQSIGGGGDDLMSLDDEGSTSGGGLSTTASRWFRQKLSSFMEFLNKRRPPQPPDTNPGPQRKPPGASPGARQPSSPSKLSQASAYLYQQLQQRLTDQREKQLNKLLALMARDPDRALKYALPMSQLGASRGVAQPGANLSRNNVDFSLTSLLGGGRPVDPWQLNAQLQARLMEAYRQQAEREQAAGRYRRAAYIYGHLMGDLNSAAIMLENGKFFIEAAALYARLQRLDDQARCLRSSGQLTEAAEIYARLEKFDAAAEMWSAVGHAVAARMAWERACEAALKRYDILKAVSILEIQLGDAARAESLLWQQWPGGHQVSECMRLAFERLANQGRTSEAHTHLSDMIAQTNPHQQTLLARLCGELYRNYPDREFRQRVEDQCRVSAVDRVRVLSSDELAKRMHILSSLHADDRLLQRDTRRFERECKSTELQLRPESSSVSERGKLKALPGVRLAGGTYYAAMMIQQELFTLAKCSEAMHCSRYVQLSHTEPVFSEFRIDIEQWHFAHSARCYIQRGSDPLVLHIGHLKSRVDGLLVSPLGGDDFWRVHGVRTDDGLLVGVHNDGLELRWDWERFELTSQRNSVVDTIDFGPLIRDKLRGIILDLGVDADNPVYNDARLQSQAVTAGGQPFIGFRNILMSVENRQPYVVHSFAGSIRWIVPSLPLTVPRLLLATDSELWMVSAAPSVRPEKIMQDEQFKKATFLPGGRIAAVTTRELFLFQRGSHAMKLIDRHELQTPQVVALLSLTAETLGILYEHGVLERYRIN